MIAVASSAIVEDAAKRNNTANFMWIDTPPGLQQFREFSDSLDVSGPQR
jgi:hypothetical protein